MTNHLYLVIVLFAAGIVFCVESRAERKPDSPKDATHIVVGTVDRVFHRESKEQNQYIVQLKVQSVERGKSLKKGDMLLVYCFQRKSSATPIPAEGGHKAIPREGQQIRALAKPRNGLLEGIYPNWFSVVDTAKKDAAKGDVGKLQGKWRVIALKADEKQATEASIKDMRFLIQGDTISMNGIVEELRLYRIDATTKPKKIDLPTEKEIFKAIFELDGDRLKLCYSQSQDRERPKSFDTKGTTNFSITLERLKP